MEEKKGTFSEESSEGSPKPPHGQHDRPYRLLFSYPKMVEDTLRGGIDEPWVDELDFSTLEKMADSHVSERLDLRFQDVVWKVRFRGTEVHLCLLIEFQSTIDPFMIFRVLLYVALFFDDLIRQLRDKDLENPDPDLVVVVDDNGRRYAKLPLPIPTVCYNGKPVWWPSMILADMINMPPGLEHLAPFFFCLLLDEHRIEEEGLGDENLLATLIGLEKTDSLEGLLEAFSQLLGWIRNPGLRRAFAVMVKVMLARLGVTSSEIEKLKSPEEIETMIGENLMEWRDQVWQEGRQEGHLEGEALVLTRLLKLKFGDLDDAIHQRIAEADSGTLLRWADRVLTAVSLADVFGDH